MSLRFRIFLLVLFLLLAGTGVYSLLAIPIWKITEVEVSGTNMLSANEIRSLSGIPLSENLFLTSFARARNNLRRISAIKEFHIYRIPPGTVFISVVERKAVAVVVLKDRSAIVDGDGYILNRNPNLTLNVPNMTDLPVISGLGSGEGGSEEKITPQAARIIQEVVLELSSFLGSRRMQLSLGGFQEINFKLDDILSVRVGRDEEIKHKMEVFKGLLTAIEGKWPQVEYVDVRYPDNPVIRYK